MAATLSSGSSSSRWKRACPRCMRRVFSMGGRLRYSSMSAPAQKARSPAPVTITARTPMCTTSSRWPSSSSSMAKVRAFSTCGRLSVSRAQSPRRESSITVPPGADRARAGPLPGRTIRAAWATSPADRPSRAGLDSSYPRRPPTGGDAASPPGRERPGALMAATGSHPVEGRSQPSALTAARPRASPSGADAGTAGRRRARPARISAPALGTGGLRVPTPAVPPPGLPAPRPHRPARPGAAPHAGPRADPGTSHVEHDLGQPALAARPQPELVAGHGLHRGTGGLVLGPKPPAPEPGHEDGGPLGPGPELDLEGGEDHALDLAPVQQLLQPGHQQLLRGGGLDPDLVGDEGLGGGRRGEHGEQARPRPGETAVQGGPGRLRGQLRVCHRPSIMGRGWDDRSPSQPVRPAGPSALVAHLARGSGGRAVQGCHHRLQHPAPGERVPPASHRTASERSEGARSMERSEDEVTVLLVEDDAVLADMYRLKLEQDGYTVRVAGDAETALAMLERDLPDLIFLDIRLPRMDGLAFLEHLRARPRTKGIPVVIVSNYSEEELVQRGLQLGALEYLIKSQTTPGRLSRGVRGWTRPRASPAHDRGLRRRNLP